MFSSPGSAISPLGRKDWVLFLSVKVAMQKVNLYSRSQGTMEVDVIYPFRFSASIYWVGRLTDTGKINMITNEPPRWYHYDNKQIQCMIQIISFKLQRLQSREKNSHGNLPNILVNRKPSERGKGRQKERNLYSKLEMIFKTFFFILFKNGLRKVLVVWVKGKGGNLWRAGWR